MLFLNRFTVLVRYLRRWQGKLKLWSLDPNTVEERLQQLKAQWPESPARVDRIGHRKRLNFLVVFLSIQ